MLDFTKIKRYPIAERLNKFHMDAMIPLDHDVASDYEGIIELSQRIMDAKAGGGKVIVMLGGAVIKEGCSRVLIDLMKQGWIDHLSGNGAVSIHDFEIAMIGETSEDVTNGLADGTFGMVEETGALMNGAISDAAARGEGYGRAMGRLIEQQNLRYKEESVAYTAYMLNIPFTIHVAIGGDIIHQHPSCDGAALGATSFEDFKIITESISELRNGVILNIGSAVLMPEVFLKALTIVRNLGVDVRDFTTANFDFMDMYRARTRVVEWPKTIGATGIDIRGDHKQTIPALHRALVG